MGKNKHQLITFSMVLLSFFMLFETVQAWTDMDQKKVNVFSSTSTSSRVILKKMEKDAGPVPIFLENAYFDLYCVEDDKDVLVKENLKTNSVGEIEVLALAPGSYYFKEILPPDGYSYDRDEAGQLIDRYAFEIQALNQDVYIQAWNVKEKGSLTLSKKVIVQNDEQADEKESFSFEVHISGEDVLRYNLNGGETKQMENGGVLSLQDGDVVQFKDLSIGASYQIYEQEYEHFYTSSLNNIGYVQAETEVIFYNHYIHEDGRIEVSKSAIGSQDSERSFEFKIDLDYEGDLFYQMNNAEVKRFDRNFSLKDGDTIQILGIPEGTKYTISETLAEDFQSSLHKIQGTMGKELVHHYEVYNDFSEDTSETQAEMSIDKKILFSDDVDTFSFEFCFDTEAEILYSFDRENWEKYDLDRLSFQSDEVVYFKNIPHGTPYRIKEISDDQYLSQVEVYEGVALANHPIHLQFKNEKIKDYSTLKIIKKVEGKEDDRSFEFTLNYEDQEENFSLKDGESIEFEIPFNTSYELQEKDYSSWGYKTSIENANAVCSRDYCEVIVKNKYQQSDEKTVLEGEKIWHYHESSQEKIPQEIDVYIYNDLDELVSVEKVRENEDGKWLYRAILDKYKENGEEYQYYVKEAEMKEFEVRYEGNTIHNTYYTPVSIKPKIEKKIIHEPKEKDGFNFILRSLGAQDFYQRSIEIKGSGEAFFPEIEFYREGIYRYIIFEEKVNHSDYQYDLEPAYLEVKVREKDYQLFIEDVVYEKNGEKSSDSAVFINEYCKESEQVPSENTQAEEKPNTGQVEEKPNTGQDERTSKKEIDKKDKVAKDDLPSTGMAFNLRIQLAYSVFVLGFLIFLRSETND